MRRENIKQLEFTALNSDRKEARRITSKCMSIACLPHSILMADTWTLEQSYLLLAWTIYLLYKQGSNILETSC